MADFQRMVESARRAMVNVLDLQPSDRVLVVQDPLCLSCSAAFFEAARAHGCQATTFLLPGEGRPLERMPDGMADTIEDVDVVINAMSGSSDEVPLSGVRTRAGKHGSRNSSTPTGVRESSPSSASASTRKRA